MKVRNLSKEDYAKYIAWRRDYNSKPEVKMKNKQYMQKYLDKPGVREAIRKYNRVYMQQYWRDKPEQYTAHINRVKAGTIARKSRIQAKQSTQAQPTRQR